MTSSKTRLGCIYCVKPKDNDADKKKKTCNSGYSTFKNIKQMRKYVFILVYIDGADNDFTPVLPK